MLLMKLEILEKATDQVHRKNNVYEKTSIQQEMFGVKMLCGKCSCIVNRTSDENSWKAS